MFKKGFKKQNKDNVILIKMKTIESALRDLKT